jgi:2-amino-4-hydroxy-6-hydroxymethyldihydropteridine diphosphokinase
MPSPITRRGSHPRHAYLGLGSNVGDRRAHLEAAVAALPRHGAKPIASSSVYETEPVGLITDQPDFLNACLRVATRLTPERLLDTSQLVEQELGRRGTSTRHGPREIDVDLLLVGAITLSSDRLVLPHPSILGRRFVLVPLLELDPALTLPDGTRLQDALEALPPDQAVRRAGAPLL